MMDRMALIKPVLAGGRKLFGGLKKNSHAVLD